MRPLSKRRRWWTVAALTAAPLGCAQAPGPAPVPELVLQDRVPYAHVAFSRDGKLIATVGDQAPKALLWDAATGRLLRVLPAMTESVVERRPGGGTSTQQYGRSAGGYDAVFSPDGRYVAAASLSLKHAMNGGEWGYPAAVWELATGRPVTDTAWEVVDSVARNPRAPWTASEIAAWGAARDDEAAHRLARYRGPVRAISADGTLGVALEGDRDSRVITIRELPSGRERARLPGTFHDTWRIALDPQARWLAVRSQELRFEVWDLRTLRRVAVFEPRPEEIAFSPDGRYLAAATYSELRLYRSGDWRLLFTDSLRAGSGFTITDLAFSPDSRRLAVSGFGVLLVDVPSGRIAGVLPGHRLEAIGAWALRDSLLATARAAPHDFPSSLPTTIEVWPLRAGPPRTITDTVPAVAALTFSPDGRSLAAAIFDEGLVSSHIRQGYRGGVAVWRVADGRALLEPEYGFYQEQASDQVAFTPNGRFLLTDVYEPILHERDCPYVECGEDENTSYNVALERWELGTGRSRRLAPLGFSSMEGGGDTFLISPTAEHVLVQDSTSAQMIAVRTLRRARGFDAAALMGGRPPDWSGCPERRSDSEEEERVQGIRGLVFSPDGALLAATDGGSVRVARAGTGELVARADVGGAGGGVTGLRFTPDSRALAVLTCDAGPAGTRLYRLELAGGAARALFQMAGPVDDILFAPNGRILARVGDHVDLYDPAGVRLATLLRATDGEWLVTTPHGLFDASARGADLVAWRSGARLVSAGELPTSFRVPGLLGKLMRGETLPAPRWPRGLR